MVRPIHRDGRWEKGGQVDAQTSTAILAALQALAEDPAGTAAAFGRRTGRCCFCEIGLTDPVSIEVGSGPICAKNYSLPIEPPGCAKQPDQATRGGCWVPRCIFSCKAKNRDQTTC